MKKIDTFDSEFANHFIKCWKRFLDDCFVPWPKSDHDLKTLHNILNNLHQDINFTLNYSNKEIPFLDVLVKNQNGKIETDIFYKETDSRQYLLFYSCHHRHTKVNIPYNLARRIRTIVSDDTTLNHRMEELKCFLNKQKYPEQVIDYGVKRAMALDKNDLRKVQPETT